MAGEKSVGAPPSKPRSASSTKPLREISGSGTRRPEALRRIVPSVGDSKRRKRVKFSDVDPIHSLNCKPDSPSYPTLSIEDSYVPKTTEYSSYKKLLLEAGSTFHACEQHNKVLQSKNYKMRSCMTEIKNGISNRNETTRPTLPTEGLAPLDNERFSSQTRKVKTPDAPKTLEYSSNKKLMVETGGTLHTHEQHNEVFQSKNYKMRSCMTDKKNGISSRNETIRPTLPIEALTTLDNTWFSPQTEKDKTPGMQYCKGLFAEKRHNLLVLAAKNFSMQLEDFASMGYDLVPHLLRRLGVQSKSKNYDELPKSWQEDQLLESFCSKCHNGLPRILVGQNVPLAFGSEESFELYCREDLDINHFWQKNLENIDIGCCSKSPYEKNHSFDTMISDFKSFNPICLPCKKHQLMKLSVVPCETFLEDSTMEQLLPSSNSSLLDSHELHNPDELAGFTRGDECLSWLLGWLENDVISTKESSFRSDDAFRNIINNMPRSFCSSLEFLGIDSQPIDCHSGSNMLKYFPANTLSSSLDGPNLCLNGSFVPFGSDLRLNSGSVMIDASKYSMSLYSNFQIQKMSAVGAFSSADDYLDYDSI